MSWLWLPLIHIQRLVRWRLTCYSASRSQALLRCGESALGPSQASSPIGLAKRGKGFILHTRVLNRGSRKALFLIYLEVTFLIVLCLLRIIHMFWRLLCAKHRLERCPATILFCKAIENVELTATGATTSTTIAITLDIWFNRIFEFFGDGIDLGEAFAACINRWFDGLDGAFFGAHAPTQDHRLSDLRLAGFFWLLTLHLSVAPRLLNLKKVLRNRGATVCQARLVQAAADGACTTNRTKLRSAEHAIANSALGAIRLAEQNAWSVVIKPETLAIDLAEARRWWFCIIVEHEAYVHFRFGDLKSWACCLQEWWGHIFGFDGFPGHFIHLDICRVVGCGIEGLLFAEIEIPLLSDIARALVKVILHGCLEIIKLLCECNLVEFLHFSCLSVSKGRCAFYTNNIKGIYFI